MHDDYSDTELQANHRRVLAHHRGVSVSMPSLPDWMPAALGVREIVGINFAPARGAADLRTELGGDWQPMTRAQQGTLACWVRKAVAAVHAVAAEPAHG
jgi:hypothetical protein